MTANGDTIILLVQQLEAAQKGVLDALKGISKSGLHTASEDGEWTVAEICAHAIEMQPLWLRKIANVDQEPNLERSAAEIDRRTADIDAHANDDIGLIRRRLQDANNTTVAILQGIEPAKLDIETKRGTAEETVRTLVINHLAEHAEQITKTRIAVRAAT